MRARRVVRVWGVVALTAPMLAGMLVAAAPAHAATSSWISPTPSDGAVINSGSTLQVKAALRVGANESSSATLRVQPPANASSYAFGPWSCSGGLSSARTCDSATVSAALNSATRPNGVWVATVSHGTSRTFYTNFPPSTPSDLTATSKGTSQVELSWSYSGDEPDLRGFLISDGAGNTVTVDDPSARSYTALYSNPDPGTYEYAFSVKALRASCGSHCGSSTVAGDSSNTATAELVTPVPPTPTPSPTGGTTGGSTGGTTGGTTSGGTSTGGTTGGTTGGSAGGSTSGSGTTTTGGTTGTQAGTTGTQAGGTTGGKKKPVFSIPSLSPQAAQRRAFALNFNSFSPSLGIPKLPPLPATQFPVTAPEGDGSYKKALPYGAQREITGTDVFTDPVGAITSIDSGQLWKSIALALIMFNVAAHVRRFVGVNSDS